MLLGFTISDPGTWTNWAPHEHAATLKEMYVFFDMPSPAYGIQLFTSMLTLPRSSRWYGRAMPS